MVKNLIKSMLRITDTGSSMVDCVKYPIKNLDGYSGNSLLEKNVLFCVKSNRDFNDLITDICKEESVTYLNYIKDEDFVQSYSLFSDGCFVLNKHGSCIFMRKITKQIGRNQNEVC